jgi:hypothetical protein
MAKKFTYEWEKIEDKGQPAIGFVQIYVSSANGHNLKAIINYLPQFPDSDQKRRAHVTLFFEGKKENLTDGMFHWIYDDIYELIKLYESDKFKDSEPIEQFMIQTLVLDEIPDFSLLSHGDYSGIEE